jgi:hypothetical protein
MGKKGESIWWKCDNLVLHVLWIIEYSKCVKFLVSKHMCKSYDQHEISMDKVHKGLMFKV